MRYLASRDPSQPHPLEADLSPVDSSEPVDGAVTEETFEVGFTDTDYTYVTVTIAEEGLEIDPSTLGNKEVPRHDAKSSEATGLVPDVILPGGVSNAHPDWTVGDVSVTVPDSEQGVTGTGMVHPAGVPVQQNESDVAYQPAIVRDFQRAPEAPAATTDEAAAPVDTGPAEAEIVSTDSQVPPDAEPGPGDVPPPAEAPTVTGAGPAQPSGNASAEEWRAWAVTQGMAAEQADLMGRDQLRAHYSGEVVPAGNATGEEWRDYAVATGMDPGEADSLGRDELRARFGG